jgi:hypothetical protein
MLSSQTDLYKLGPGYVMLTRAANTHVFLASASFSHSTCAHVCGACEFMCVFMCVYVCFRKLVYQCVCQYASACECWYVRAYWSDFAKAKVLQLFSLVYTYVSYAVQHQHVPATCISRKLKFSGFVTRIALF